MRLRNAGPACRSRAPSNSTSPAVGGSRPAITFKSVLLPAPFGPQSNSSRPGSTVKRILSSSRRPSMRRVTFRTSMRN